MNPIARRNQLTVRQVLDDTIVYDEREMRAHSLNRAVALVWRNCDGNRGSAELTALLADELGIGGDEAIILVELALEQLSRRGLLETEQPRASSERRMVRRQLLRQLVIASIAIPLIMTIRAPHVSAQTSTPPPPDPCRSFGLPCVVGGRPCCPGLTCAPTPSGQTFCQP